MHRVRRSCDMHLLASTHGNLQLTLTLCQWYKVPLRETRLTIRNSELLENIETHGDLDLSVVDHKWTPFVEYAYDTLSIQLINLYSIDRSRFDI